jgi:hypothetical protein
VPTYPPRLGLDVETFRSALMAQAETFNQIAYPESSAVPPIALE